MEPLYFSLVKISVIKKVRGCRLEYMRPVGVATILPISQKISYIKGKGGNLDYMW